MFVFKICLQNSAADIREEKNPWICLLIRHRQSFEWFPLHSAFFKQHFRWKPNRYTILDKWRAFGDLRINLKTIHIQMTNDKWSSTSSKHKAVPNFSVTGLGELLVVCQCLKMSCCAFFRGQIRKKDLRLVHKVLHSARLKGWKSYDRWVHRRPSQSYERWDQVQFSPNSSSASFCVG